MTKKERIAELERRVAELEAQPHIHYMPYSVPPTYGRCYRCGGAFYVGHPCSPIILWGDAWTLTSGFSNANGAAPDIVSVTLCSTTPQHTLSGVSN